MKTRNKALLTSLIAFASCSVSGQMNQFGYSRPLSGIKDSWHRIELPDDMFARLSPSMNDIRIYGITAKQDTIEVPYILNNNDPLPKTVPFPAKIINKSYNARGSYFTLLIPSQDEELNTIYLEFKERNYDWKITLKGSNDQQEWFTILENYRVLAIHNNQANYTFSQLIFPDSKYKYYRALVPGTRSATLVSANYYKDEDFTMVLKQHPVAAFEVKSEKHPNRSTIDIELEKPVPVNRLKVYVGNKHDYFRPVTLEYVADSFKTEKGWKYTYALLSTEVLNSLSGNEIHFMNTTLKHLKLRIENHDNEPLIIDSFAVKGPEYELIARFDQPAEYYMVYGNANASAPDYDIVRFTSNIPVTLAPLAIGDETPLSQDEVSHGSPLFQNKLWLWVIMGIIIIVIGWFSLSMMRKVN